MNADRFAQALWYEHRYLVLRWLLLPLSALFGLIVTARRVAYAQGWFRSISVSTPVIVVGNLTVGGTGKTPLVIWLARALTERGYKVALICRGYGGSGSKEVTVVRPDTDPSLVGDEAVLLAQSHPGLVIAGADRTAAARLAVTLHADLVISDDGLQHYRLQRSCELLVVDGTRGFGSGRLLPAGPLREPVSRARTVDVILRTQREARVIADPPGLTVRMRLRVAINMRTGESRPLADFRHQQVHVVTGIGNPDAFMAMLEALGLDVNARVLADHAAIAPEHLDFADDRAVLVTDKDAVKCRRFADGRVWRVPLEAELSSDDQAQLWSVLDRCLRRPHQPHHH
jgi:tetraacyldisaccharide 4'-kinase